MKHRQHFAALAAGTALVALQTAPAFAEGTTVGTTITITATIDYRGGGVAQNAEVASDSFAVDRKVNLVITRVSDPTTQVSPGQADAVIAFEITNLSNDTIDLVLAASQSGSDDFDAANVTIYRDDGNGVFDVNDTATTLLDEVAEDETLRVFIVADIPLAQTNAQVADVILSATAHSGGSAGSQGAILTTTAGADTDNVETVLADGAGADDSANDGVFSAAGSYTVFAATLDVTKTSRVISDPVNGTTNPKAIPGALIEYCVTVANGPSSATATDVVVTDILPGDLTFDATFGIRVDGTPAGSGQCNADGTPGGSISGSTVTAPLSDIAASAARTAYFRATIN